VVVELEPHDHEQFEYHVSPPSECGRSGRCGLFLNARVLIFLTRETEGVAVPESPWPPLLVALWHLR
jgi:hypothetical protein